MHHWGLLRLFGLGCLCFLSAGVLLAGELELDNPDDSVTASRKLYGTLTDGEPAVYFWEGNIFGRRPGERDKLLFRYLAMNVRTTKGVPSEEHGNGFKLLSREILIYLDPKTGAILRNWQNPYTGKEVEVVHVANDPVNHTIRAKSRWGSFRFKATFQDQIGWSTSEIPLFYPNPLGGKYQKYVGGMYQAMEIFTFFFDKKALLSKETDRVSDAMIAWSRISQWLPWMEMGDVAGQMIYSGGGKRIVNWEALPEKLKQEIKTNYPAFSKPPPLDDQRRNDTSWTVFKKHVDAKQDQNP